MKNRYRYGALLVGSLLVAILGAGCGTSTLTGGAHKVSCGGHDDHRSDHHGSCDHDDNGASGDDHDRSL